MKYLQQASVIVGFTFSGELLQRLLPLPFPAALYGLLLLFIALCTKLVEIEAMEDTGNFLLSIMPVLFVAPAVNLTEYWHIIAPQLLFLFFLVAASTFITFGVSGRVVEVWMRKKKEVFHE